VPWAETSLVPGIGNQELQESSSIFDSLKHMNKLPQAPLPWLLEIHRVQLLIFFTSSLVLGISLPCFLLFGMASQGEVPNARNLIPGLPLISVFLCISVFGISFLRRRRMPYSPRSSELLLLFCLLMLVGVSAYMPISINDALLRHRALTVQIVCWKILPALFGLRKGSCSALLIWSIIHDVGGHYMSQRRFGERQAEVNMFFLSISFAVFGVAAASMQQLRLRALYDMQLQLRMEKGALRSLLFVVCKACFWMSSDGDTVAKANRNFNVFVGKDMQDAKFSSCLISEHECLRVKAAFTRARQLPRIVPTTLKTEKGPMDAELVIIDRRDVLVGSASSKRLEEGLSFLVGIICKNTTDLNMSASFESGSPRGRESRPLAEVLADAMKVDNSEMMDRGWSNTPTQSGHANSAALSCARGVASETVPWSLATSDHLSPWRLHQQEIQILPDSWGTSCSSRASASGRLHGTPVSIRTTKASMGSGSDAQQLSVEAATDLWHLCRVRHPNIAVLYGLCVDAASGHLALVCETIYGLPLNKFLLGPRDPVLRYRLSLDVCGALRFLHNNKHPVVHGDLRPSHVCVEGSSAKLLETGFARLRVQSFSATDHWLAPEVRRGAQAGTKSDVFSLGRLIHFTMVATAGHELAVEATLPSPSGTMEWPVSCPFSMVGGKLCQQVAAWEPSERPTMDVIHPQILGWSATILEPPYRDAGPWTAAQTQALKQQAELSTALLSSGMTWEDGIRLLLAREPLSL